VIAIKFIGLGQERTEAMYSLRYSVVLVTLIACVAFPAVESSRNSRDGVQERSTPELAISDEQRGDIFEIVMRISDAPIVNGPTPEITDALPEQMPMQDLPAEVSHDVPLVQGYKFAKFDDRILIVHPSSRLHDTSSCHSGSPGPLTASPKYGGGLSRRGRDWFLSAANRASLRPNRARMHPRRNNLL
jgi:hypothetical protein